MTLWLRTVGIYALQIRELRFNKIQDQSMWSVGLEWKHTRACPSNDYTRLPRGPAIDLSNTCQLRRVKKASWGEGDTERDSYLRNRVSTTTRPREGGPWNLLLQPMFPSTLRKMVGMEGERGSGLKSCSSCKHAWRSLFLFFPSD